jgi:hypothetical protein
MNEVKTIIAINNIVDINFEKRLILENVIGKGIIEFSKESLPNNVYTPIKDDKIYLLPECNVPRFKLKTFCENYNVALVKFQHKANAVFVGPKFIEGTLKNLSDLVFYKPEVLNFLEIVESAKPRKELADLITEIKNSDSNFVVLNYRTYNDLHRDKILGYSFSHKYVEYDKRPSLQFISEAHYDLFKQCTTNPNCFNQTEILRRINTGGVMTRESFESIKRLFESNDLENVKLGMEIMANCDYEKSCVYLLLLIMHYGSKMYSSTTHNHVNFKALLKFFDIKNTQFFNLEILMKSLTDLKLLTQHNLDIIMPEASKVLSDRLQNQYFVVDGVKGSPLVESIIDKLSNDSSYNTEIAEHELEQITPKL